jgi:hypothetical protein
MKKKKEIPGNLLLNVLKMSLFNSSMSKVILPLRSCKWYFIFSQLYQETLCFAGVTQYIVRFQSQESISCCCMLNIWFPSHDTTCYRSPILLSIFSLILTWVVYSMCDWFCHCATKSCVWTEVCNADPALAAIAAMAIDQLEQE